MFGPDGKPLMFTPGAKLIGGPKGTEDFPPLDDAGVEAFLTSAEQTVQQVVAMGQPLDIPCAALPPASLAHLAQTLRAFQARIKELEEELDSHKIATHEPDSRQTRLDLGAWTPAALHKTDDE